MEYAYRPLVQALRNFKEVHPVSFHVPGHKNGMLSGLPDDLRSVLAYDFTELAGLDDLHEPEGVIEEAQQRLSSCYGSDCSFFLVNGSTVGNLAMIYATCQAGDTVIVQRNAHKSVFHALELTGANPVFVTPAWDAVTKAVGTVSTEQIQSALELYPEAKAVVLTYPTYYGVTGTMLEETISLCHTYGIPVLVDEAHGAHFVVGDPFPCSALAMGADVVVHSAHKTLPAMTMASFLHVKSKLVSHEKIAHYLHMFQSSSPSYLLMASLDDARSYVESMDEQDKLYFIRRREDFIRGLGEIPMLQMVEADDPLKLILRVEGYSGYDVQEVLEGRGIFAELVDPYQVLFVLPLLKKGTDYPFEEIGSRISVALKDLQESHSTMNSLEVLQIHEGISSLVYTKRQLSQMEKEWVPFEESLGCISAASIIPYPPGIPLLIEGERIEEVHIQSLRALFRMKTKFQGTIRVQEKQVCVVKNRTEE
ncbi:aminotransferase class I/II-fold pyridoxal phosphate-dependent enzyme [Sporosarcina sp. FSL K6-1522]|uniref:aminotransferase class I/II-fold pyridoxal phosphate-dependent enzyme n=1 Tax=Sporosarcina sp. FSL K6-1522 TaxID=2921554 RepID=UPI00315A1194